MTAASRSQAARLAVWSAFLAITLRLLHGATFGHLSIPLGSLDELAAWADHTSPTVMALAVVRLAALAAAWYLAIATILAIVADIAGWRRLAAVVAALSPGIVRRVAARAAGVGLAAGAVLAVAPLPSRLLAAPASAGPAAEHAESTQPQSPGRRPAPPPPSATMAPVSSPGAAPASDPRPAAATPTPGTTPTTGTQPEARPTAASPTPGTTAASGRQPDRRPTAPLPTPEAMQAGGSQPDRDLAAPLPAPEAMQPDGSQPDRDLVAPRPGPETMQTGGSRPGPGPAGPDRRSEAAMAPERRPPVAPSGHDHETATMVRLPGTGTTSVATMTQLAWSGAPPSRSRPPASGTGTLRPAGPATPPDGWTVTAGDSFWSIATEILADRADTAARPPAERDVRRYWLQLIEANRDRLTDPANPDRLIPGQQLRLPPPPGA